MGCASPKRAASPDDTFDDVEDPYLRALLRRQTRELPRILVSWRRVYRESLFPSAASRATAAAVARSDASATLCRAAERPR